MRDVTGDKNALDAKINPSSRQIWKIDPPFFFPLVGVRLENKTVNAIRLPQKPLMILAIMLVRDFGVQPKEGREKRILRIGGINVNRRFRNDGRHITKRDGGGGAIIKEDDVRRRRIRRIVGGGINRERNVHDSTGEEHVGSRVKPFDPSARRIQFLNGRIVVAIK